MPRISILFDLAAGRPRRRRGLVLIDHASTKGDPDGSRKATQRGHSAKLDGCGVLYASRSRKQAPLVTCEREQLTGEFMELVVRRGRRRGPVRSGRPATKEEQKWGLALIEKGAEGLKGSTGGEGSETQADREASSSNRLAARILEIVKVGPASLRQGAPGSGRRRMPVADFDAARALPRKDQPNLQSHWREARSRMGGGLTRSVEFPMSAVRFPRFKRGT